MSIEEQSIFYGKILNWLKIGAAVVGFVFAILIIYYTNKKSAVDKEIKKKEGEKIEQKFDIKISKFASDLRIVRQIQQDGISEEYLIKKFGYKEDDINSIINYYAKDTDDNISKASMFYSQFKYDKSKELFLSILENPADELIKAICHSYLGSIYFNEGNFQLAIESLTESENILEQKHYISTAILKTQASNYYDIALYYKTRTPEWDKAKKYYLKAINLFKKVYPEKSQQDLILANIYNDLYLLLRQSSNKNEDILKYLDNAIQIKSRIFTNSNHLANFKSYLRSLKAKANYYYITENNYEVAIELYQRMVSLTQTNYKDQKEIVIFRTVFHTEMSNIYQSMFNQFNNLKYLDLADQCLRKCSSVYQELGTSWSLGTMEAIISYYYSEGLLFKNLNQIDKAIKSLNDCLDLNNKLISICSGDNRFTEYHGHIYLELAKLYVILENCNQVTENAKSAIKLYKPLMGVSEKSKIGFSQCKEIIDSCK